MSVQTKDPKGQETLSVVCHGTEELEFEVKSSWIFVEQPPQTAGQVRQQADEEQQTEQNVSECLFVISGLKSSRWRQVQRLLRGGRTQRLLLLLLLPVTQRPTVACAVCVLPLRAGYHVRYGLERRETVEV